ncbi:MAG: hypothetical protein NTZ87_04330 [Candidatus Nomurabacteria bacterium]|nr:hypothetical protein [Candidatus Nomurabacteria bacterium]
MESKFKFMCEKNKYTISATNTISLPVLLKDLPSEVVINGNKLILKSSFHVSLVCINEIIKKYCISVPNFRNLVVKDFCDFVKTNDIYLLNYLEEFRFVTENDLKTVIVICKVSNLDKFFDFINKKYKLKIEYPPTHVTLYTLEGKLGIFLIDANDIKNLTKSIPNPIEHSLL